MTKIKNLSLCSITVAILALLPSMMCARSPDQTVVDIDAPGTAEVVSSAAHFSITVKGVLDQSKYNLPKELKLLDYQIYILVHPLAADGWWRQNPATARKDWEAQAYLGGIGQHSAKDGERFEIVAVLAKGRLRDKYDRLQTVVKESDTFQISEVKTLITRRPK